MGTYHLAKDPSSLPVPKSARWNELKKGSTLEHSSGHRSQDVRDRPASWFFIPLPGPRLCVPRLSLSLSHSQSFFSLTRRSLPFKETQSPGRGRQIPDITRALIVDQFAASGYLSTINIKLEYSTLPSKYILLIGAHWWFWDDCQSIYYAELDNAVSQP